MIINRQLLTWSRNVHVYLSVALLLALVFFALTGITLNHADIFNAEPTVSTQTLSLPDFPRPVDEQLTTSAELEAYLRSAFGIRLALAEVSREDEFLIIDYQAPGSSTLIEIDLDLNEVFVENTEFGVIAMLNDLHKGRHTDVFWDILIDLSAILLVIFALAGFVLLLPNKRRFNKVMFYSSLGIIMLTAAYFLV